MRNIRLRTTGILALLAATSQVPAAARQRASTVDHYASAVARARDLVHAKVREQHIPGYVAAVYAGGQVVWAEGFGYANLETRTPVWPSTRFRIGSVSKTFTAAALGLLVKEGRLDPDEPIQRYVPDFPEKRYPITIRQVAGHLAGIRHYRGAEFSSNRGTRRYEKLSKYSRMIHCCLSPRPTIHIPLTGGISSAP